MADISLYVPAGLVVSVIEGQPPVDQSALVASLTAERDALQAQVVALQAKIAAAVAALA